MSARDNILARIRKAQGRDGSQPAAGELASVRAAIELRSRGPVPANALRMDLLERFRTECARVGTTLAEVADTARVPAEVARYLQAVGQPAGVVGWPELAGLDWAAAGVAFEARAAGADDRVGVTGCFCAVAETGTVLLLGSAATPKRTALLPETHVCVVSRARLVATMEDAYALLRAERGELPRSTWFVSGPSRTADIEQTIVIGAHGPYRAHAILVP